MGWRRMWRALRGTRGCRGDSVLLSDRRNNRRGRLMSRIRVSANLYMKAFTLELELGQRIVSDQSDQFAQLVHVDRSFQVLRQGTMASPATIAVAFRPGLVRLLGCRLLTFLIAHRSFDSGRHRNLPGTLVAATNQRVCLANLLKQKPRDGQKANRSLMPGTSLLFAFGCFPGFGRFGLSALLF